MANLYLSSGDNLSGLTFGGNVFGAAGSETVSYAGGATGIVVDQNVERVSLAGATGSFTYQQQGNQLVVFSGTTVVATIALQNDADGTLITFTNGTVSAKVSAAGLTLGGTTVPAAPAAAAIVIPTTIDTSIVTPGTVQTVVLTVGADSLTGTAGDDVFNGAQGAGGNTFTVGDQIDGQGGNDTLNVTQTAAITVPVGVSVKNVETVNFLSGTTGNSVDVTSFTGLKTLNITGLTAQSATAAATTDVNLVGSVATGATTVTGGNNVSVVETGAAGGTVGVSGAAGTVGVTSTILATNGSTGNAITVTGGTAVTVTQKGANAVNTTVTDGAVTVTGTAATKTVSVTADKAATAGATTVGHVNGAVSITDANAASATAAGSIETVSVASGAAVTVNSGALKILNLSGTITSVNAGTLGALTTAANTTLAVNVNGLTTTGGVTIDSDITTLNLAGATAASTIDALTANGVKALNISGDAKVTLTAQTLGALTDVVVTNTAGASLGSAIGAGVNFTGGAGADAVTLTTGFTKAITMGAGNDTVTYGGPAGTGGSINGGDGEDTIVLTGAQAAVADDDGKFNAATLGFEVLGIATGATQTLDMVGLNSYAKVSTLGANGLTLNNFAANGLVTLTGAGGAGGLTVGVRDAAINVADVFNLALSNNSAATVAFGGVTVANVETINVSTVDAGTGANTAATIDTVTITAADATKIVVTGNNGLDLSASVAAKVTTFDASGVVGNGTDDTAANLAVKYTSDNNTAAATVSITGGAGNDVLIGNAAKDTIVGGAGNDSITGGTGVDTLTGGAGSDTFVFASGDAGITGGEKITDYTAGVGGDILDLASTVLIANNSVGVNVTGAVGGSVDLTAKVSNGVITLSGADVALVDTIGEIKAIFELLDADNTAEVGAISLNGQTYVLADAASGGGADSVVDIIQLSGLQGIVALSTTAAANTITIA